MPSQDEDRHDEEVLQREGILAPVTCFVCFPIDASI